MKNPVSFGAKRHRAALNIQYLVKLYGNDGQHGKYNGNRKKMLAVEQRHEWDRKEKENEGAEDPLANFQCQTLVLCLNADSYTPNCYTVSIFKT